MSWNVFTWFAVAAMVLWAAGSAVSIKGNSRRLSAFLYGGGVLVLLAFIAGYWITVQRPPMRTMGETRLWFSLFLSLTGGAMFLRLRNKWIMPLCAVLAGIFMCINIFKPEIHNKVLMPALQSAWFVPHVISYMLAYATLGAATVAGILLLVKPSRTDIRSGMEDCDTLVRIGWAFLTLGIVMGALWAKVAWGDFWTWDPKETWAAVTWLGYMVYLHHRRTGASPRVSLAILMISFVLLLMCWFGVNYLPSAQGGMHTY